MEKNQKSSEDYIEAVYVLSGDSGVRITDVATFLKVSKPSVHNALHKLITLGWAVQKNYGTIALTMDGEKVASGVYKKHLAVKKLLTDVLGVSEKTANDDACQIEHCISEETTQKLLKFISLR